MYDNIYITHYKENDSYKLHLKLDNNKFRTEKTINLVDLNNRTIKRALISLVSDLNFKDIPKFYY